MKLVLYKYIRGCKAIYITKEYNYVLNEESGRLIKDKKYMITVDLEYRDEYVSCFFIHHDIMKWINDIKIINCHGNKCRVCDDIEWCSACSGEFDDEIYIEKWLKKTINIKYIPDTSIISTEIYNK